jgi:hypothetical protein
MRRGMGSTQRGMEIWPRFYFYHDPGVPWDQLSQKRLHFYQHSGMCNCLRFMRVAVSDVAYVFLKRGP